MRGGCGDYNAVFLRKVIFWGKGVHRMAIYMFTVNCFKSVRSKLSVCFKKETGLYSTLKLLVECYIIYGVKKITKNVSLKFVYVVLYLL